MRLIHGRLSLVYNGLFTIKKPMNKNAIIECVPNFSEGKDADLIKKIADSIENIPQVKVLHIDMGADANRTVITFAGSPQGVEEAAFIAIKTAAKLIDMRQQKGTHPRLGACDVMPLVPVAGLSIEELVELSYRLTERIGTELQIPVFNYEKSARVSPRKRLENIRKGEYEGLETKMRSPEWYADNGLPFNSKSGATVLGARPFLLAYNVNLKTRDVAIAKAIASAIRESGTLQNGVRKKGKFKGLKAIGWDVAEFGMVQVSTNITDTDNVGLHDVFEEVKRLSLASNVDTDGSELIGLCPKRCLLKAGDFYRTEVMSEKESIALAIERLGLRRVDDFKADERIIEYLL